MKIRNRYRPLGRDVADGVGRPDDLAALHAAAGVEGGLVNDKRMSRLTRMDQKFLSFDLSSRWNFKQGIAGFISNSNDVVLTAFCSSAVNLPRLSVNVSAMRNSISIA